MCVCDSPRTSGILLPHFQAGAYKYFSRIAEPCQLAFASGRVSAGKGGGGKGGERRCPRKMRHLPGDGAPAPGPDSRGAPPPLGMLFPPGEVLGHAPTPPGPDGRTHPISSSRGLLPGWAEGMRTFESSAWSTAGNCSGPSGMRHSADWKKSTPRKQINPSSHGHHKSAEGAKAGAASPRARSPEMGEGNGKGDPSRPADAFGRGLAPVWGKCRRSSVPRAAELFLFLLLFLFLPPAALWCL